MKTFIDRYVLLPMRQKAAGHLAWRHFGSALLFFLVSAVLFSATNVGDVEIAVEAVLRNDTLILRIVFGLVASLVLYLLLLVVEAVFPCQNHANCVQRFYTGQLRQDNPIVDWMVNSLRMIPLATRDRRKAVLNYLIFSEEEGFNPLADQDAARIHAALKSAWNDGAAGPPQRGEVEFTCLTQAVGNSSLARAAGQVAILMLSVVVMCLGVTLYFVP